MKRVITSVLAMAMLLSLCACSNKVAQWQEQYDLGVRYLSEGHYEEAIIAFEAAIKIYPKRPESYLQEAYAYVGLGDLEAAKAVLERGYNRTKDESLLKKLEEFENGQCLPLNAYGGTEFTWRKNYYAFSDLSSEQQQLIEKIGNAAINNDADTLVNLIDLLDMLQTDPFYKHGDYTIWNDYKIELHLRPYEVRDGDLTGSIEITLRPENGMGYYCDVYSSSAVSTAGRDHWFDYSCAEEWITCPCVDWQWNGDLIRTEKWKSLWRSADGTTDESVEEITESGKMVNSLRDGTFTKKRHWVSDYDSALGNDYDHYTDETETITSVYQNSVLIEKDGKAQDGSFAWVDINEIGHGDLDSMRYYDPFYW